MRAVASPLAISRFVPADVGEVMGSGTANSGRFSAATCPADDGEYQRGLGRLTDLSERLIASGEAAPVVGECRGEHAGFDEAGHCCRNVDGLAWG